MPTERHEENLGREVEHHGRKYREILDEAGEGTDYWKDLETGEVCTLDLEGWDD